MNSSHSTAGMRRRVTSSPVLYHVTGS